VSDDFFYLERLNSLGKLSKLEKYFSTIDWSCILNKINKQLYIWPYYSSFLELLSEIVDNRRSDYFAKDYKKEKVIKITSKVLSTSADEELILSLVKAIGDQQAVEPLIFTFKGEDSEIVLRQIVNSLGKMGDSRAIPILIEALKHKDKFVFNTSTKYFLEIVDSGSVELLIKYLKDKHWVVRCYVAEALGKIGDPRAITPLLELLKDKDWDVRSSAAEVFAKIGDSHANPSLVKILEDKDWDVRRCVTDALAKIGGPTAIASLVELLEDSDKDMRRLATISLGKIGDQRAVDNLIETALDEQENAFKRNNAVFLLGELGDPRAVPPLIEILENEDFYDSNNCEIRAIAAESLCKINDPRVVKPLVYTYLYKSKYELFYHLLDILTEYGDKRLVEPLIEGLKEQSPGVRSLAAELLGNLGDSRAVKPLIPLLKDEFDHVRLYVAEALGKIGDPRAVDALVHTTLYEKNFNVYNNAITSLIIIGDSSATEKLIELGLYDKDPEVRSKATAVLGEISNPKFDITTIYPDLEEKYGKEGESDSSDFGVRCEDSTAERLAELTIYDEDKEMRERALNLLVEIFDSRAIDKFVDIVLYDEDSEIRKRAGKALGKIGNVRACEKIMEHVISTDDKIEIRNAREALRIIGFGEFIEEFEFLLLDRNR